MNGGAVRQQRLVAATLERVGMLLSLPGHVAGVGAVGLLHEWHEQAEVHRAARGEHRAHTEE